MLVIFPRSRMVSWGWVFRDNKSSKALISQAHHEDGERTWGNSEKFLLLFQEELRLA